jgi:hypothetical protein
MVNSWGKVNTRNKETHHSPKGMAWPSGLKIESLKTMSKNEDTNKTVTKTTIKL